MVSALCTTSKPYVLVRRDSDDKTTSRVPPGTPRDAEIRGWSLQARLSAREGGPKSIEVLWVLEVDPDRRRRPRGPANGPFGFSIPRSEMGSKSTRRWVPFDFFLPSGGATGAPPIPVRVIPGTHLGHEGHFSGPGGRTAARVPFPRVRSRPLCRGVAKSGPHDPGGCPV